MAMLYGHQNRLSGEIPDEICDLSKLKFLNLSHNNFEGRPPADMAQLTSIQVMLTHGNNLIW